MIVEGKGAVEPRPARVRITNSDLAVLRCEADRRNRHRSYSSSASQWSRGLASNPILIGMVGELAIETFLQSRGIKCSVLDFSLSDGDGGKDAVIAGVSYQVKTSAKSYDTCLVRRVVSGGRVHGLVSDRYVFCRWEVGDSHCDIRGWCDRKTLLTSSRHVKSKRGDWFNLEMPAKHFLSVESLASLIRQEAANVQ